MFLRTYNMVKKILQFHSQYVATLLVVAMILPYFFFGTPKKAEAVAIGNCAKALAEQQQIAQGLEAKASVSTLGSVPVSDRGSHYLNSITAANTSQLTMKESCYDSIMVFIAKVLIQKLTADIVQWINSGFDGNPAFVTNPEQFFLDAADGIAGELLIGVLGKDIGDILCSPFDIELRLALAFQYSSSYQEKALCTLTQIIDNTTGSLDRFLAGNFDEGSWSAWFSMTQNENNNPYGSYLNAKAELGLRIAGRQILDTQALAWGNGFLSWESCDEKYGPEAGYQAGQCKRKSIKTPGSVINSQIEHTLGTDLRQLELADEINEIIGALTGQLINQVMSNGGLLGGTQGNPNSSDRRSLVEKLRDIKQSDYEDQSADTPGIDFDGPQNNGEDPQQDSRQNLASGRGNYAAQDGNEQLSGAERAVDGRKTGIITEYEIESRTGGVAITRNTGNPWWQIELENNTQPISSVKIYRQVRHDDTEITNTEAFGQFRIFVSPRDPRDYPGSFNPDNPPEGVWMSPVLTMPQRAEPKEFEVNTVGRFVRIQRVDSGNHQLRIAEIEIFPNQRPEITLNGSAQIELEIGALYNEQGATVSDPDNTPPRLFPRDIVITSNVNTAVPGTYQVRYNAADSGGARAQEKIRTVVVKPPLPRLSFAINGRETTVNVPPGGTAVFAWSGEFAERCTAQTLGASSNAWFGSVAVSGSMTIANPGAAVYQLTCTNATGSSEPKNVVLSNTP